MPTATKKVDAWFDWPGDPDKARVRFCLLTDQDFDAIKQAAQKARQYYDRDSKTLQAELQIDSSVDRKEAAIRATLEWDNFYDSDRKLMDCTRENIEFWACDSSFVAFMHDCQVKLSDVAKEHMEAARKNS